MSAMKKSEKLTLIALGISIFAGLFFHFYFGCNGLVSTIIGVIFAAGLTSGFHDAAATTSVIDSKVINKD